MAKAKAQTFYDVFRDLRRLAVETDGVKAVCGERHHILLAACDEQHVALVGELLEAKNVIVRFASRIQESHDTEWAIHLHKRPHCVAEHRLFRRGAEGVGLLFPLLGFFIRDSFQGVGNSCMNERSLLKFGFAAVSFFVPIYQITHLSCDTTEPKSPLRRRPAAGQGQNGH